MGGAQSLLQLLMPEEGSAPATPGEVHLGFVAGIMTRERLMPFEKVKQLISVQKGDTVAQWCD